MRAVTTGMITTYPVGGVAWDYGQYILGLEQLGFDVYYLEDTGGPTYDPVSKSYGEDPSYGIRFLNESLTALSPTLSDRWHFRSMNDDSYGMTQQGIEEVVASADLFLNVSGGTLLRDAYMRNPCKVLIDSDPGWNHFVNYPRWDANPGWLGTHGYRGHDHFFTYAMCLGQSDCLLPDMGICWYPTRPPVSLEHWQPTDTGERWTTVMTWNNFHKPVEFKGTKYGTKEMEFGKIESLALQMPGLTLELATGGTDPPLKRWQELGWNVTDSQSVSHTLDQYRNYIQTSRGELSVAKNLYVATNSGWFSCRSICYLAASRPVVVQETGFSEFVPTGNGLFSFANVDDAKNALETIESNYEHHQRSARLLAEQEFAARKVVSEMLTQIGLM